MKFEVWDKTGMNIIVRSHGTPRVGDSIWIYREDREAKEYEVLNIVWHVKEAAIDVCEVAVPIPSIEVKKYGENRITNMSLLL